MKKLLVGMLLAISFNSFADVTCSVSTTVNGFYSSLVTEKIESFDGSLKFIASDVETSKDFTIIVNEETRDVKIEAYKDGLLDLGFSTSLNLDGELDFERTDSDEVLESITCQKY